MNIEHYIPYNQDILEQVHDNLYPNLYLWWNYYDYADEHSLTTMLTTPLTVSQVARELQVDRHSLCRESLLQSGYSFSGQFTLLPLQSVRNLLQYCGQLPSKCRNQYLYIFMYMARNIKACGYWSHPIELIAQETKCDRVTIIKCLQSLAAAGFVERYSGGFTGNSSRYILNPIFYTNYEYEKYQQYLLDFM